MHESLNYITVVVGNLKPSVGNSVVTAELIFILN